MFSIVHRQKDVLASPPSMCLVHCVSACGAFVAGIAKYLDGLFFPEE